MQHVSHHDFNSQMPTKIAEKELFEYDNNDLVNEAFDNLIIEPLLSGKAYYVNILEFKSFETSSFSNRFDDFKLDKNIKNGYVDKYNVELAPFLVSFEFKYSEKFIQDSVDLFSKIVSSRYCNSNAKQIKDIRNLDLPCAIYGDFEITYIQKEGWYGIKDLYLHTFQSIRSEYSSILANKLNRLYSHLYFSFASSDGEHILGVFSDFRDYGLTFYNTKRSRKVSNILTNTKNFTYPMYQVEPLSPLALSYKQRTFFLIRQHEEENQYAFIIYLSGDEVSKINKLKAWARADKHTGIM
ncbi:hypothetical protein DCO58_09300 [Helicobacter saguini]|uniref:Uncharacterized protein n=1 Tax=Helicobacter saguini TaxID=1548018 RepID=A0A347VP70_9HELI|nr:hypothetical protein [Helicobacter saguini]MWV61487.1 hypothetical protein [Helicobacter saguini]MWV67842.1 hypothetical protein [Helicobacter saguini]MWV70690.1 hypothetical protein [Helicobacter saguini]MWV72594.1 hypothetical protein [Helicobacter saguini]TLD94594.1 hypothetical protein LS64_005400 [Helicobacter saguini]